MSSNVKQGGLLSNKDLLTAFSRGIHLNGMNDYPAQMHSGYTYAMIPALKKIYKDDKEKRVDAYRRHMTEYFNVTPYVVGLPMGVTLALEEQNAQSDDFDTATVTGVKTALMGPLSAIGAMTATNVALTTPITFGGAGETDPTALQALFDTVMPKMLPLLLVLACYWLLGKKKVNVVVLLIALIVAGVVLALCGIIG